MDNIRIGVVGTNFVSDWFCSATRLTEGVTVSAVYSRSGARGGDFAKRNKIGSVYTDYSEMLDAVDAVYIASPNYTHCELAVAAMERGKHVLCEKMMAASYSQALRMRACADKMGVVLLEAMRPDFDPALEVIRENLYKLGRIRRAHFEYCQYSSRYDSFISGSLTNAFDPKICNSALADIGIYPVHMAVMLFGKPKSVKASSVFLENGFEATGSITLEYEGMLCDVVYSKVADSVTPSVIEGERGSITLDKISAPSKIEFIRRGREAAALPYKQIKENMRCEIAAFRDMINQKGDSSKYLDATVESIRIVNEAYRQTGALKYMNIDLMK